MNLVVGDYFKLKLSWEQYVDLALELIKWFNNHSIALGILLAQQRSDPTVIVLVLILPVLTRWTSHHCSVDRLLELERFMRAIHMLQYDKLVLAAGNRRDAKIKAKAVLACIPDDSFWHGLRRVKHHLEPLAIATNVMQGSSTHLDLVLLTLGFLYRKYLTYTFETDVSVGILTSLQMRWAKNADHDVFILAVFFNPYIRHKAFRLDNPLLCQNGLFDIALRVYKRMFSRDADVGFDGAFFDYHEHKHEFSRENMKLDRWKARHEQQGGVEGVVDTARIWQSLDTHQAHGRNSFVQLAIRVLSIVPNSAGTERIFSEMGAIHSKARNRLKADKVHKMVTLKMDLRRRELDLSPQSPRKRRRDAAATKPTVTVSHKPLSVRTAAATGSNSATALASTPPSSQLSPDNVAVGPCELADEETDEVAADDHISLTGAGDFTTLVEELAAESNLEVPVSLTESALDVLRPDAGITRDTALLLKNVFDFDQAALLAYGWPAGKRGLEGEMQWNEFAATDGLDDLDDLL